MNIEHEHICTHCGVISVPVLIDDHKNGDDSYLVIECEHCHSYQEITYRYQYGEREDMEWVGSLFSPVKGEENEIYAESYQELMNVTDSRQVGIERVIARICQEELHGYIEKIEDNENFEGGLVITTSEPDAVESSLSGLIKEDYKDNGFWIEFIDANPNGKTDNQPNQGESEKKSTFLTSTIKNKNSRNEEQYWINKTPGLTTDVILERRSMIDPADFEKLAPGMEVNFQIRKKGAYYYCEDNSVVITPDNSNSTSESKNDAEALFIQLLQELNYPFLYFDKEFKNFSNCFDWSKSTKPLGRPDFLLCKKGLGTYAVDVSERTSFKNYSRGNEECITISKKDFKEANRFSRTFNMPWWWAVRNSSESDTGTWYMLSLFDFETFYQSVVDDEKLSKAFKYDKEGSEFLCIPVSKSRVFSMQDGDKNLFI